MSARVLVLGASGFIGRRIVAALVADGDFQPVAASRQAAGIAWGRNVEALNVDASDPKGLRAALTGAQAVINCVAGHPALIRNVAQGLFAAAIAMPTPPRVVNLGSLAAYGSATGLVEESAPLRGDLDEYSAAKAQTDVLAAQYRFAVTLRPGIVYGPGSPWWSDRIARLLVSHRLGDLGTRGSGICNLIYVEDVAAAAVHALRISLAPHSAFNLSSSGAMTWNEYFAHYAAALNALPVKKISSARWTFETRLASLPLKAMEAALRAPGASRWNPLPPIRPWLAEICTRTIQMDVTAAQGLLGMRWTPLETGLAATAQWFRGGGRTAI